MTSLPELPNSLSKLECFNNQLTSLPVLPNSLKYLYCFNNTLTSLPVLPNYLITLNCCNNNISCFPVFPNSIALGLFNIANNPFTCLPNYINAMDATTLLTPLCTQGDSVNNPNGCIGTTFIENHFLAFQTTLFPNPTPNYITIEKPNTTTKTFTLSLTNIQGQLLLSEKVEIEKTHTLDLSKFPNGIYFLRLQNEKENYIHKVLIQR